MNKLVPLTQAEEVLKVNLADLLAHPGVAIKTKKQKGKIYIDPNEMMKVNEQLKKGENGKT